ncbi:expansin-a7 [Phtheirospermum japonicum]|uniref:Expansin n=1 Tax=Phtheirospermum japonicum TaxID=374723 RepID=A0A830CTY1_9LAMI|nr:expansin-a7 [Phtheirospermum japonicum]
MASLLHSSRRLISLIFLVMAVIGKTMAAGYYAAPVVFRPTAWKLAYATFYGDETASETMGGACGYENLFNSGYGTATAALSSVLFNNGYGCGQCFQLRVAHRHHHCHQPLPSQLVAGLEQRGVVQPPRTHFDMAKPAFMKIAQWKGGIVPVMFRRVTCIRKGGLRFRFQGNGYWLLVYVMNVGGGGDVANMWVKGSKTGWISMSHNWGASYQAFATLGGQSLSFKITSYTSHETIIAYNVAPANWHVGMTYSANVNFH